VSYVAASAFIGSGLLTVRVDEGSSSFVVDGDFLLDSTQGSLILYFGHNSDVLIPYRVERICRGAFSECSWIHSIEFEASSTIFEIESRAFSKCLSLESLSIPASVQKIDGSAFCGSGLRQLRIEASSTSFLTLGFFVIDFGKRALVRYFGDEMGVMIPMRFEVLCTSCFCECLSIVEVHFETDSKLFRIESEAFASCSSLCSICIPNCVEILCPRCFISCESLQTVIFDSPSKLCRLESYVFAFCSSLRSICIDRIVLKFFVLDVSVHANHFRQ
jgi:hypothetical protein